MENFKKYVNELLSSKKQIALGLVAVLFFGAGNGWFGDFFTVKTTSKWSSDIPAIQKFLNGGEVTGDNQLDEAYEWILENVELTGSEGVIISVERSNESVKIVYTYDEETTATLNGYPLTEAEIIALAEELAPLNEQIMEYLETVGITDINLDMDVRDSEGHVYLVLRNGELIEYNVKEGATNTKRDVKKEEKKETKEEIPEGTCIYCDGPLKDTDKKSVCSNCVEQMGGMTFESQAPYGRCPKCNCANASDKGYQGDYCDDCFAAIKEEEYKEKHQYGDCQDCGVYLTKNQASSYGGRCPDCYAKYYGDNDTHMGSCERCGDRVDMDHTNSGWGYNHLCSGCTGELQMQESQEDATPWAG